MDSANNRNFVMAEVLRKPLVSRSAIAETLGLTMASVSRITRDLIDADLLCEGEIVDHERRAGRRFIGLAPFGKGGFVVGVGLNAFRQSVTLANLENEKIAEWVSPHPPGPDGADFIKLCLNKAEAMLQEHVADRRRFFGVGIAVAGELDIAAGTILGSATFGWTEPVPVREMTHQILDAPLALETPPCAINQAEAEYGIGRDKGQIATLICSLGFGIGVRKQSERGIGHVDFGRVLTQARSADPQHQPLDQLCGGLSVVNAVIGSGAMSELTDTERGQKLNEIIRQAAHDPSRQDLLAEKGRLAASHLSLVFDVIRPDMLLLAGPLAQSPHYANGFRTSLHAAIADSGLAPEVKATTMTPAGASRWLALRANVAMGKLDLELLKKKGAA